MTALALLLPFAPAVVAPAHVPRPPTPEPPVLAMPDGDQGPALPEGIAAFEPHLRFCGLKADYARAHAEVADVRVVMYPGEPAVQRYADLAHVSANCWALLATAQDGCPRSCYGRFAGALWFPEDREAAVVELRRLLGEESFARGDMPSPAPCHASDR